MTMNNILRIPLLRILMALNLILVSIIYTKAYGQNPFMPPTAFIPDGEPHVFEHNGEERMFVYGSRDERITGFCGFGHDVWSAPVNNLTKWMNHGEIFHVKQVQDIGYGIADEQHFGAPDCVYNPKTKKYYLYTFLGKLYKMDGVQGPLPKAENYIPGFEDWGPKCVMASSDSPAGPFVDPVICDWPPENKEGTFDPSVIVDKQEDGSIKVYAFWGMKKGDRWAELDPIDMHTIINPKTQKHDRNAWHKTLDPERVTNSSLFEGSSIKKIDDNHYVFIYSPSEMHCALGYCYSSNPKGPWTYGGRIINNGIDWKRGNNHGSIVKVLDQWYVVYHKATNNSMNRQAMIEPIDVKIENEKVIIPQVEMTSQGVNINGLDAFKRYNANVACFLTNNAFIDSSVRNKAGLNPIKGLDGSITTIGFKYFNFGDKELQVKDDIALKLNCKILQPVHINVFVALPKDANNKDNWVSIANHTISNNFNSKKFKDYSIPLDILEKNNELKHIGGLKDKLAVFVEFSGSEKNLCELIELEFSKGNHTTPNPLYDINIKDVSKGKVTILPAKARNGESVKLSIEPADGFIIEEIIVTNSKGEEVEVNKNRKAPYANISYNFFMPNSPVNVEVKYKH